MEQPRNREKILSAGTLLFVACWAAYCASYLGRINYTAALTAIVAHGVFSKSHAGLIGTVYFFCYAAGQIFSGILGDRVSPYKLIGAGLAGTVCANILMPLCSGSYIVMSVVWGFNGIVQSMLWTPILYIISNVLPEEQRRRACLYIAASFPVGSLLSYVISAGAIKFASWHFAFFIPAGIIACIFVFWCFASVRASKILGRGERKSVSVRGNTGRKPPRQAVYSLRRGGHMRRHTRSGYAQRRRDLVGADSHHGKISGFCVVLRPAVGCPADNQPQRRMVCNEAL